MQNPLNVHFIVVDNYRVTFCLCLEILNQQGILIRSYLAFYLV